MAHAESSEETTQKALEQLRLSIDEESGEEPPSNRIPNGVNGKRTPSPRTSGENFGSDKASVLQKELETVRREKDALSTQYQNLVSRLNTMRTTLGNKLKQDAEELDRREALIQQLTTQNEDLNTSLTTLQSEIVTSNAEAERASKDLETLRSRSYEQTTHESLVRERELRELQVELERCRMERDEWEREALEGRIALDEAKTLTDNYNRELEIEREASERLRLDLESEKEKSTNLQSVLEDFQNAKDLELQQAVKSRDVQLNSVTQSLAEYKSRALNAELQLEETSTNSSRSVDLEKEVKEKNLLIEKLRHEAIILNEHLTEALRRLRRNQTDSNVDRRLVSNVLLQFLTTPRGDSKRFEMLGLLATVLSWGDAEREKAGLQRSVNTAGSSGSSLWPRSSSNSVSSPKLKGADLDLNDETESFSQRWVEFLLKESTTASNSSGNGSALPSPISITPSRSNLSISSLPGSPRSANASPAQASRTLRLGSFTSTASSSSARSLSTTSSPPAHVHVHAPSPTPR